MFYILPKFGVDRSPNSEK